jgi:hypothetical protein
MSALCAHCVMRVSVPHLPLYMYVCTNTKWLHHQFLLNPSFDLWLKYPSFLECLKEERGLKRNVEERRGEENEQVIKAHAHTHMVKILIKITLIIKRYS